MAASHRIGRAVDDEVFEREGATDGHDDALPLVVDHDGVRPVVDRVHQVHVHHLAHVMSQMIRASTSCYESDD